MRKTPYLQSSRTELVDVLQTTAQMLNIFFLLSHVGGGRRAQKGAEPVMNNYELSTAQTRYIPDLEELRHFLEEVYERVYLVGEIGVSRPSPLT